VECIYLKNIYLGTRFSEEEFINLMKSQFGSPKKESEINKIEIMKNKNKTGGDKK